VKLSIASATPMAAKRTDCLYKSGAPLRAECADAAKYGTTVTGNPATIDGCPITPAHNRGGRSAPKAGYQPSVLDVERVTERLVEPDPAVEIEVTYGFLVEQRDRNGDQVVATDDALIAKALGGREFNF
jgi:hypothetical protein